MNGVIFADAPALLAPDDAVKNVTAEWSSFWPQRLSQLKLYGMGVDAYNLIGSLYAGDGRAWPVRGMSGDLSLDDQGRVHRTLPLAQFRNGLPATIDAPPATGTSSSSLRGFAPAVPALPPSRTVAGRR